MVISSREFSNPGVGSTYIVIYRQTVSLYHNSSVCLDTQNDSKCDGNLTDLYIYIYIYIYIYPIWHLYALSSILKTLFYIINYITMYIYIYIYRERQTDRQMFELKQRYLSFCVCDHHTKSLIIALARKRPSPSTIDPIQT